jgi:hypothetical protein
MVLYDFLEAFVCRWKLRTSYGDNSLLFKVRRCFSFATSVVKDNRYRDANKYTRVKW